MQCIAHIFVSDMRCKCYMWWSRKYVHTCRPILFFIYWNLTVISLSLFIIFLVCTLHSLSILLIDVFKILSIFVIICHLLWRLFELFFHSGNLTFFFSFLVMEGAQDCNQDPFGNAYVDSCGVCSGGKTLKVPSTLCNPTTGKMRG